MSKTYTTYVTTWGTDPLVQIQDMINKSVIQTNTKILLAFASFNFSGSGYVPGFNITLDETKQITELVHMHGAKIGLSVGGATYPFYGSDLYDSPGDLALNINNILTTCNFDSVDFDVEDSYQNVPSNFAIQRIPGGLVPEVDPLDKAEPIGSALAVACERLQCASLINTLKSLNNNLSITLTTPAQAWSVGCYQQQLINLTIGNLTAWQPMEYDLWIDPSSDYYQQIQYDINFYINTWGVSSSKITLGLMPGKDDMGHDLSLQRIPGGLTRKWRRWIKKNRLVLPRLELAKDSKMH